MPSSPTFDAAIALEPLDRHGDGPARDLEPVREHRRNYLATLGLGLKNGLEVILFRNVNCVFHGCAEEQSKWIRIGRVGQSAEYSGWGEIDGAIPNCCCNDNSFAGLGGSQNGQSFGRTEVREQCLFARRFCSGGKRTGGNARCE